jgi:hypothetical protein
MENTPEEILQQYIEHPMSAAATQSGTPAQSEPPPETASELPPPETASEETIPSTSQQLQQVSDQLHEIQPSAPPTRQASRQSLIQSVQPQQPSVQPSVQASRQPSVQPQQPSVQPSILPSIQSSRHLSRQPSQQSRHSSIQPPQLPVLSRHSTRPVSQQVASKQKAGLRATTPDEEIIIEESNTKPASNRQSEMDFKASLPQLLANEYITQKLLQSSKNDQHFDAVVDLLNHIATDKEKTNDKLFIISAAYDKVYKKFNDISLCILILSSVVTLIEAFRLTINEFVKTTTYIVIDINIISFTMNITTLSIGTVITILSSIVRFKNYREILEQLKDKQNLLIAYREKYSKKYEKVLNLLAFNSLTREDIKSINEKIAEYDSDIKTINVMEYLRNEEIIKFNRYKAYFDFQIRKIDIDKEIAIQKYESYAGLSLQDIENRKNNTGEKYRFLKKLKEFFYGKDANEKSNFIDDV